MTDPTPTAPLRVTTCYDPTGRTVSCYSLVEDTHDARREHRAWHKHEESVKEGLRSAIKRRDEEIAKLARELGEARSDVQQIVVPEPVLGIEISRGGWDAEDDEVIDEPGDDWADFTIPDTSTPTAGEPDESPADEDPLANPEATSADLLANTRPGWSR